MGEPRRLEPDRSDKAVGTIQQQIEDWKKKGAHVLVPDVPIVDDSDELYEPRMSAPIVLSTDKDEKEVYSAGQGKFRLHAKALNRLAIAANFQWDTAQSGPFITGDKDKVAYRVRGGVYRHTGTIMAADGYYDMNLSQILDDLQDYYEKQAKKNSNRTPQQQADWIEFMVDQQYRQKRKHSEKMCETGARNRVIRQLLNLRSEYTADELKRPFICFFYQLRINVTDDETRQMIKQARVMAALGIYGPARNQPGRSLPAPGPAPIDPASDPNVDFDGTETPEDPDQHQAEAEMQGEAARNDFVNASQKDQLAILKNLMSQKGYAEDSLKYPLVTFKENHRTSFYDTLVKMEDVPEAPDDDDIPF